MSQEKSASKNPTVSASGVVLSGLNSPVVSMKSPSKKSATTKSASIAVPVSPALAAAAAASKKASASVPKRSVRAVKSAASATSASGRYEFVLLDPKVSDPKIQSKNKAPKASNKGRDRFQVARKLASKAYSLHYKALGVNVFKMVIRKEHADPTIPRSYGVYDVRVQPKTGKPYNKGGKSITSLFQAIPKSVGSGDEKLKMIQRFLKDAVASPKKMSSRVSAIAPRVGASAP